MKDFKKLSIFLILFISGTGLIAQAKVYMSVNTANGYLVPSDPGAPGVGINESDPQHSLHILETGHESTALFLDLKQTQAPVGQGVGGYFQPDYAMRVNYQPYSLQSSTVFSVSESGQTRVNWQNTAATENLVVGQDMAVYRNTGNYVKLGFDGGTTPTLFWRNGSNEPLQFKSEVTGNSPLYLSEDGQVGVNTSTWTSNHSLHTEGGSLADYSVVQNSTDWGTNDDYMGMYFSDHPELRWKSDSTSFFEFKAADTGEVPLRLTSSGKVGINTDNFGNSNHSLYIAGSSVAEEMYVLIQDDWGDFVFEKEYDLMPLEQLDDYLKVNKHLPDFPSAAEVEQDGLALGETERLLTIKVEELTLYILQLKKEIDSLKKELEKE